MKQFSAHALALTLLSVTIVTGTLLAAEDSAQKVPTPLSNAKRRIVATVDGEPIYADEVQQTADAQEKMLRYQHREDSERLEKELARLKHSILGSLIDKHLLLNEFKRIGGVLNSEAIDKDMDSILQDSFKGDRDAFAWEIAQNGITLERFRQLRAELSIMTAMRSHIAGEITLTDAEVRDYYDKHSQQWGAPVQVKIRTLTLPSDQENARKVAEDLRQKIAAGSMDFAEAARAHSQDSHAEADGAWDWTPVTNYSDHIRKAVTKTPKGQISEVIDQGVSLIILRVDDRRTPAPPDFEEVKAKAADALREEISQKRVAARLNELREKADIQKMDAL